MNPHESDGNQTETECEEITKNIETENGNNIARHAALCEEIHNLYIRKNHDYGDSFHQTWTEEGAAMARIRLSDKLNRFKTLTRTQIIRTPGNDNENVENTGNSTRDESVRDTLMDLANYALMTVMELDAENRGDMK